MFLFVITLPGVGLVRTVVSISHCGCDDPGSIPGLDMNGFMVIFLSEHRTITLSRSLGKELLEGGADDMTFVSVGKKREKQQSSGENPSTPPTGQW